MRLVLAPKVAVVEEDTAVAEEDKVAAEEDKVAAEEDKVVAEEDKVVAEEAQRAAVASNHRHSTDIIMVSDRHGNIWIFDYVSASPTF
jgi:cobalamin biosynthesis protein CbiG